MPVLKPSYNLRDFYYDLPDELIAQHPAEKRDLSRLFVLNRTSGVFTHSEFSRIGGFLKDDDILVFNNARVLHARIFCRRESGGRVETLLTEKLSPLQWRLISNRTARLRTGELIFPENDPRIYFKVMSRENEYIIVETSVELDEILLAVIGEMPLPPYIRRSAGVEDNDRYQTVYARKSGAAAAPTAGLHFTDSILDALRSRGIKTVFTTLYVSWGTFSPVRDDDLTLHRMHSEKYELDEESAEAINSGRDSGRRIISVGTTALRVLESTFRENRNVAGNGVTDIFIYPPYKIRSCDAMLTNLHTPGSTLLMLVCAFAGYDNIMNAYHEAVRERYRFFSYGDAMLIV